MKLRAGELTRRINFERKSVTRDEQNAPVETWAAFASFVPAAFKPVSGTDDVQGGEFVAQMRGEFWIRFRSDIKTSDRIIYDARTFDIIDIVEMNYRDSLKIAVVERRTT